MQKTRGFIISVQQIHDYSRLSRLGINLLKRNIEGGNGFKNGQNMGFRDIYPIPCPLVKLSVADEV